MLLIWMIHAAFFGTPEALWDAARAGDLGQVKALVESGVDVNSATKYGATALTYACDKGHLAVVEFLVEKGADINAVDTFYQATPLSWALFNDHDDIVVFLIGAGVKDVGQAFSFGVNGGKPQLVKAAIDSGRLDPELIKAVKSKFDDETPEAILELVNAVELPPEAPGLQLDEAHLQRLAGAFHNEELGMTVEITAAENQLQGVILPDRKFTLKPISETAFHVLEQPGQTFVFSVEAEEVSGLEVQTGARNYAFKTGPLPQPTVAEEIVEAAPPLDPEPVFGTAKNWPMFRGQNADGNADGQGVPTQWNAEDGTHIAWKTAIPGLGNASPVIWGSHVFLATAVSSSGDDTFRPGLYGDVNSVEDVSPHSFRLLCLDLESGKINWDREVLNAPPLVKRHLKSTHANSTPVTNGNEVVVLFGSVGVMACYGMKGEERWRLDLGAMDSGWFYDKSYQWGHASSPIIYKDTVIVQVDVQSGSYIAAFQLKDGHQVWRTDRDEIPTWGSPNVVTGEVDEVVTNGPKIRSYHAVSGELLWEMSPNSEVTVATPIFANGLVYVTGGYPPARPVYAVKPGGRGDLSQEANKRFVAWSLSKGGTYMPTPIAYGKYLFTVANDGRLTCYDAQTGEIEGRYRLGAGVSLCASPIAADGRLYFATDSGEVIVITADTKFRELARNPMGEILMATPAASARTLVVRGLKHTFGIRAK